MVLVIVIPFVGIAWSRNAPPSSNREVHLEHLQRRAEVLSTTSAQLDSTYYEHIRPIYIDLMSTGRVVNHTSALLTATYVNKFAGMFDINPMLVSAVIKVENPWLIADTASYAGAVGLMQVMPDVWRDEFLFCGEPLHDMEVNVCKGVGVLSFYLSQEIDRGTIRALLRYNGCVSTPGCESYATKVLGHLK